MLGGATKERRGRWEPFHFGMLQNRPRRRIDADNDNEPELGQHHSAAHPSSRLRSGRTRLLLCLWYHSPALTRPRKGQTGRPGTARRGRASRDCAALEGLEPGEPNCNSPLPSRMVDEHRRQPVCTTVAVTKWWHGEAGVWRIARRRTSAQPRRMATPQPFRLHIIVKRSITAANIGEIGKIGKICTHRRIDASTVDSYRNGACSHAATPPSQRQLLNSLGPFIPFCPLLLLQNSIPAFRGGGCALFCCCVIHRIRLKEPL